MIDIPGLEYIEILDRGHCLYQAVSLSLGEKTDISYLQQQVVEHVKRHGEDFEQFFSDNLNYRLEDVLRGKEWRDYDEIFILMQVFGRPIVVTEKSGKNIRIKNQKEILPFINASPIFVYYDQKKDHYHALRLLKGTKFTVREILARLIQEDHRNSAIITANEVIEFKDIPDEYLCPILGELMDNPVTAGDGRNYEKRAIKKWFREGHTTSPVTGDLIKDNRLTKNAAIRSAIEQFKARMGVSPQTTSLAGINLAIKLREEFITELLRKKDDLLVMLDEAGRNFLRSEETKAKLRIENANLKIKIFELEEKIKKSTGGMNENLVREIVRLKTERSSTTLSIEDLHFLPALTEETNDLKSIHNTVTRITTNESIIKNSKQHSSPATEKQPALKTQEVSDTSSVVKQLQKRFEPSHLNKSKSAPLPRVNPSVLIQPTSKTSRPLPPTPSVAKIKGTVTKQLPKKNENMFDKSQSDISNITTSFSQSSKSILSKPNKLSEKPNDFKLSGDAAMGTAAKEIISHNFKESSSQPTFKHSNPKAQEVSDPLAFKQLLKGFENLSFLNNRSKSAPLSKFEPSATTQSPITGVSQSRLPELSVPKAKVSHSKQSRNVVENTPSRSQSGILSNPNVSTTSSQPSRIDFSGFLVSSSGSTGSQNNPDSSKNKPSNINTKRR